MGDGRRQVGTTEGGKEVVGQTMGKEVVGQTMGGRRWPMCHLTSLSYPRVEVVT